MTKDKGRFTLYRKIEDSWQWQNPLHRGAWMWILIKAAYKPHSGLRQGQCYFTLSQSKRAWGMTIQQARSFIRRGVQEGDIIWEPGRPGVAGCVNNTSDNTSANTSNNSSNNTSRGKITLLNLYKYPASFSVNNTSDNTSANTSLEPTNNAIEKESIKKESKEPSRLSAKSGPHQELIKFFTDNYEDLLGTKYVFQGGKDASAAKRILKSGLSDNEIQNRIVRYLEDEDPFVEKQGFTLSFFAARINSYAKTTKNKGEDSEPEHPLWPEIRSLLTSGKHDDLMKWQELRLAAIPYARKKSQCGDKRDPPEEVTRAYMIKIYEVEKVKVAEPP